MRTRSLPSVCAVAASLLAGPFACKSAPPPPRQSSAQTTAATELVWTKEFLEESVLSATEISIEGPPGLIAHVAYKQLPDQQYKAKTIPDGFLQEISVGEDAANPIWIQIDHLAINAFRSARILERVTPGPVRIRARGEAMWKNLVSGQEQRAETLELLGAPAK